jgi:predicted component of type VI protein secretion system
MPYRLVALDEGPDIPVDREMIIIGRHPQCDARLDSIRVSRRHCCMFQDDGEVIIRDLGSTNGIRINGQRVEKGRLRLGDELSIAHIRFRLDDGQGQEMTLAEPSMVLAGAGHGEDHEPLARPPLAGHSSRRNLNGSAPPRNGSTPRGAAESNPLAAAVRELLPPGVGDRCRIQVIVQMQPDDSDPPPSDPPVDGPGPPDSDLDSDH